MDAMQYEDPDARPKRLVILAGAGMVVATGFATLAAMALPGSQRHTATPDIMVDPNVVSRSGTSTAPAPTGYAGAALPASERSTPTSRHSSIVQVGADITRETGGKEQASTAPDSGGGQLPGGDQNGRETPPPPSNTGTATTTPTETTTTTTTTETTTTTTGTTTTPTETTTTTESSEEGSKKETRGPLTR